MEKRFRHGCKKDCKGIELRLRARVQAAGFARTLSQLGVHLLHTGLGFRQLGVWLRRVVLVAQVRVEGSCQVLSSRQILMLLQVLQAGVVRVGVLERQMQAVGFDTFAKRMHPAIGVIRAAKIPQIKRR